MGCVFPMVISSEFLIDQYRDDDHREDAPHFIDFIIDLDSKHRMAINARFFHVFFNVNIFLTRFWEFFFGSVSHHEKTDPNLWSNKKCLKYDSMLRISKHFLSYFLELTPIVNP